MELIYRRAQSTPECQICENHTKMKWKCEDCSLSMCDYCKRKIHPKFKSFETHRITSIDGTGMDEFSQLFKEVVAPIISSYTTTVRCINKLLYSGNDIIYMMSSQYFIRSVFLKCKLNRSSLKILNDYRLVSLDSDRFICFDFALANDGGILSAPLPGDKMKWISPTCSIGTLELNQQQLRILAIYVRNNELLIGTREQGPKFPVTDNSTRQVLVYTVDGEGYRRIQTIEFDQNGKRLFHYIVRITTGPDNVIYVIDRLTEEYNGRVVAVDRNAVVRFIYDGLPQDSFEPRDIVITSNGCLLVSDRGNNKLHALNKEGEPIGVQDVSNIGIKLPHSLCLDDDGLLLIGCDATENDTENAKIYVVKILL